MDDQVNKIIEFLKGTLSELDSLNRNQVFSTTSTLDSILIRHYDKSVAYKQDLATIRQQLSLLISSNTDKSPIGFSLEEVKDWYITLLKAMISELERLGLPSKNDAKIDKSINVSVNQNQNQTQNQTQVIDLFLDGIRNEITGKQLNELKAIMTNEPNIENAKSKLLSKLRDFGIDICSNIIANIITNPSIWGGL